MLHQKCLDDNQDENIPVPVITRKVRTPITVEILKIFKHLMNEDESVKKISGVLGLSKFTIYKLMKRYHDCNENNCDIMNTLQKCGRKKNASLSNMESKVLEIIQQDCSLVQKGIIGKLKMDGLGCTQGTISNILKRNDITRKRLNESLTFKIP